MADIYTKSERSRIMGLVRDRDTSPELAVRSALHRMGYRFRLHRRDLPGRPDIVLPSRRLAIFVHGCFWHGHDCGRGSPPASRREFWLPKLARNVERDKEQQEALRSMGWTPAVIWECETRREEDLRAAIRRALSL